MPFVLDFRGKGGERVKVMGYEMELSHIPKYMLHIHKHLHVEFFQLDFIIFPSHDVSCCTEFPRMID
jgi:hypothetical protein